MFTRPIDLDDGAVVECLSDAWGIAVDSIGYQPVGFGSHHWIAHHGPQRWFVTVDDLDTRLIDSDDDRPTARRRLDAALATAHALHSSGHTWVIAPTLSRAGTVIEAIDERFVCALYPFIEGRTSSHGHYNDGDERRNVVTLLAELHRTNHTTETPAIIDDHQIPRRDSLDTAMRDLEQSWEFGPYADPARRLLSQHRRAVAEVLDRYDDIAETIRRRATPVITHGEPHRGNVIITADGPTMIDWDTTRLAPPERDLWSLIDEDETIRDFYEQHAQTSLDDDALTLYRLSWDLCEIALFMHEFRQPHTHTADTATAWNGLTAHLEPSRWTHILNPARRTWPRRTPTSRPKRNGTLDRPGTVGVVRVRPRP